MSKNDNKYNFNNNLCHKCYTKHCIEEHKKLYG